MRIVVSIARGLLWAFWEKLIPTIIHHNIHHILSKHSLTQKITFLRARDQEQRVEVNAGSWGPGAKQQPATCLPHPGRGTCSWSLPIICFGAGAQRNQHRFQPKSGAGSQWFILYHICWLPMSCYYPFFPPSFFLPLSIIPSLPSFLSSSKYWLITYFGPGTVLGKRLTV